MEGYVLEWFVDFGVYAIWLSILLNVIISVLGVLPSVFLTAANIGFFGFGYGLLISVLGEAFGAIVSFYLYRKGINKVRKQVQIKHRYLERLQQTGGLEAFWLIIALRVFPFMPSGLVTLVSAGSKVGIITFSIASTLGKIPALMIEAYSVSHILNWTWQGKVILGLLSIVMIGLVIKKYKKQ
ncbi:MAG: TVP38/TMEM64 family protein [Bacillus sp. (in: firmicutes)]